MSDVAISESVPQKTPTSPWPTVLVAFLVAAILFTIFFPGAFTAGERWPTPTYSACLSNVKQINLGFLMYSNDYDDRLPPDSRWMDLLDKDYIKRHEVFRCPVLKEGSGYAMHSKLSGKSTTKVERPERALLDFESKATNWNAYGNATAMLDEPRHEKTIMVGYLDGHAKAILPPGKSK